MKDYIGQILGIAIFTATERFVSKVIEKNKNLNSNSLVQIIINFIKRKKL
jgi:hypothetical protein